MFSEPQKFTTNTSLCFYIATMKLQDYLYRFYQFRLLKNFSSTRRCLPFAMVQFPFSSLIFSAGKWKTSKKGTVFPFFIIIILLMGLWKKFHFLPRTRFGVFGGVRKKLKLKKEVSDLRESKFPKKIFLFQKFRKGGRFEVRLKV